MATEGEMKLSPYTAQPASEDGGAIRPSSLTVHSSREGHYMSDAETHSELQSARRASFCSAETLRESLAAHISREILTAALLFLSQCTGERTITDNTEVEETDLGGFQ
ncbi:unnamed protein product [Pleuronectes platessa]|uniref:Uncharacterized protein n=1 Tax=Pleuronectes platessa TaxID=8262 RepID=A0A9N7Z7V7_PLEPL|nr:unnamed protein product [Pleuronectes platessa]